MLSLRMARLREWPILRKGVGLVQVVIWWCMMEHWELLGDGACRISIDTHIAWQGGLLPIDILISTASRTLPALPRHGHVVFEYMSG